MTFELVSSAFLEYLSDSDTHASQHLSSGDALQRKSEWCQVRSTVVQQYLTVRHYKTVNPCNKLITAHIIIIMMLMMIKD